MICIENTQQGGMFVSFGAHTKLTIIPFEEKKKTVELFLHISFDLPGPLRTASELKKLALPTANVHPDATALTEDVINWLKRTKNIKLFARTFPTFPKNQNWQF